MTSKLFFHLKRIIAGFFMAYAVSFLFPLMVTAAEPGTFGKADALTAYDTILRYGPSKTSLPVVSIPAASRLEIISDISTDDGAYYLVRYNGRLGYVDYYAAAKQMYVGPARRNCGDISADQVFWLEGNIWENSYEELLRYYNLIPEQIRKSFECDGFHIIMSEDDITAAAYESYGGFTGTGLVEGVCDYELGKIYIQDESPRRITHEMGHYVNDKFGFAQKKEFHILCQAEAPKISLYAAATILNPNEYFAEIFDLYVRDPEALAVISPASYLEIQKDMLSISAKIN